MLEKEENKEEFPWDQWTRTVENYEEKFTKGFQVGPFQQFYRMVPERALKGMAEENQRLRKALDIYAKRSNWNETREDSCFEPNDGEP